MLFLYGFSSSFWTGWFALLWWLRQRLDEVGIPIPNYALVNRDFPDQEVDLFVEEEDYVEINGKRIFKPFVEKPVDGTHVLSAV